MIYSDPKFFTAVIANEVKQPSTGLGSTTDLDCFANARNDRLLNFCSGQRVCLA